MLLVFEALALENSEGVRLDSVDISQLVEHQTIGIEMLFLGVAGHNLAYARGELSVSTSQASPHLLTKRGSASPILEFHELLGIM